MLKLKEIFASMQGEGSDTGLPTIFVRFAGCSMGCSFCDETKDAPVRNVVAFELVDLIRQSCELHNVTNVVFTGGEPLEQNLDELAVAMVILVDYKYRLGIETNGTRPLGQLINYLSVISLSPKTHPNTIKIPKCTNLKILYPYISKEGYKVSPPMFEGVIQAQHKIIQPIYGEVSYKEAFAEVVRIGCGYKLGVQLHKLLDME